MSYKARIWEYKFIWKNMLLIFVEFFEKCTINFVKNLMGPSLKYDLSNKKEGFTSADIRKINTRSKNLCFWNGMQKREIFMLAPPY